MKKTNRPAALLVSLLAVGCTATSQLPRTTPVTEGEKITPTHVKTEEVKLDSVSGENDKSWNDIVAEAEETKEFENLDELFNEYAATAVAGNFTETEQQHVKSSASDPFGGKSYIHLNLDNLKESFCYPVKNGKLISNYGKRGRRQHTGIDIKAERGQDVFAAFDGVVRLSKPYSGYGNVIVIRHNNGLETVYSHNSRNLVSSGDVVAAGDVIAKAGRTGRATTEHVHFETRVAGQHFNPNLLVDAENNTLKSGSLYIRRAGSGIVASNNRAGVKETEEEPTPKVVAQALPEQPTAQVKPEAKPEPKPEAAAPKNSSEAVYHTIVSGNTLGALARQYGTTVSAICALNGIKPTTVLQLKQRIRVK